MSSSSPLIALVIAPHHDDETIGAGGLIAHLTELGVRVDVLHVFAGDTGVAGQASDACRRIRVAEATAAMTKLGATLLPGLAYPDRTSASPQLFIQPLISAFRKSVPDLVIAPHLCDADFEHRLVSVAVEEAFWMASAEIFPDLGPPCAPLGALFGYEVWTPMAEFNLSLNITHVAQRKRAALSCYGSQTATGGWDEGGIGLSSYRGTTIYDGGQAEVFTLRRATLSPMRWAEPFFTRKGSS